jgi:hypothetical protein
VPSEHHGNPTGYGDPADALRERALRARIRGDCDAYYRLLRLARFIDAELEYAQNVERGMSMVHRRSDAPRGAILGWYFRHDPIVRYERQRIGATVP